jgi:hypothetical protein
MILITLPVMSIVKKYRKAVNGIAQTKAAFVETSARLDPMWIEDWTAQETIAMKDRGDALRIYDVSVGKGVCAKFASLS